jgi:hypothetical protein
VGTGASKTDATSSDASKTEDAVTSGGPQRGFGPVDVNKQSGVIINTFEEALTPTGDDERPPPMWGSVSKADTPPVSEWPNSRHALQRLIEESGPSPFAPASQAEENSLTADFKKTLDTNEAPFISISGSIYPRAQRSDKNIEVLTAWRTITSHPKFKVC